MNHKCKHLTLDERKHIETLLNQKTSFKSIGRELGRDCTTISKEVSTHTVFKRIAIRGVTCNNCRLRFQCVEHHLCRNCDTPRQSKKCHFCKLCNFVCPKYAADICPVLQKAPHVCNGCDKRFASCTLEKHLYDAVSAHNEYLETLSQSRTGLTLSEGDISYLNGIVSPLLYKRQSLHHICIHHKDSIMVSESTLYRLVDYNLFDARNIDLPRKVRYASRYLNTVFPRFFFGLRSQKPHKFVDFVCSSFIYQSSWHRFGTGNLYLSYIFLHLIFYLSMIEKTLSSFICNK